MSEESMMRHEHIESGGSPRGTARLWYRALAVLLVLGVVILALAIVGTTYHAHSSPRPDRHIQLIPPAQVYPIADTASQCQTRLTGCVSAVAALINAERKAAGIPPIRVDWSLIEPSKLCRNALGHARSMAATGTIWHVDSDYPNDSFPIDITGQPSNPCRQVSVIDQNVGAAGGYDKYQGLVTIHQQMMSEQHDRAYCLGLRALYSSNHACSIDDERVTRVGIGIVYQSNTVYLVESFVG